MVLLHALSAALLADCLMLSLSILLSNSHHSHHHIWSDAGCRMINPAEWRTWVSAIYLSLTWSKHAHQWLTQTDHDRHLRWNIAGNFGRLIRGVTFIMISSPFCFKFSPRSAVGYSFGILDIYWHCRYYHSKWSMINPSRHSNSWYG